MHPFTSQHTIDVLKKEAKRWLKALRTGNPEAHARLLRAHPKAPNIPTLRDIQYALAQEHGHVGWKALVSHISLRPVTQPTIQQYEEMAQALLDAYRTGTPAAMQRHWKYTWHRRSWEGMRVYVQLDLGKRPDGQNQEVDISLDDARLLIAREHGFEDWQALLAYVTALPKKNTLVAAKPVTYFSLDVRGKQQAVGSERDWHTVLDILRQNRVFGLNAEGQMTDAVMEQVSHLDHITALDLSGSKELTDSGLRHLAHMPRLQYLNLSGTGMTDQGLDALSQLTELRTINLSWTNVTDVGVKPLFFCEHLESVDLWGTPTGDGALKSLTGKAKLRHVRTGNNVTDAGLSLLHHFPTFKTWQGGDIRMALLDFDAEPNYLLLRGSFTDQGIAQLEGLDGLFALNLDDARLTITQNCLKSLIPLPNLGWLAFPATDEAMPYIAAMPHLRFLMCQDTPAGDDGWSALSRSTSLEKIWGRRCYNLRSQGFLSLAEMPLLRSLSVSCKNVEDSALAALPQFPGLRELMPMDIPDVGYRHIGKCEHLEALILMYCRETSDVATEYITHLRELKRYFASYTRITNRTPDLLSEIESLEDIEFSGCANLTNQGIESLVRLPHLRELRAEGMGNVTSDVITKFRPGVRVRIGT